MSKTTLITLSAICTLFAVFVALFAFSSRTINDTVVPVPVSTDSSVNQQIITPLTNWRTAAFVPVKERGTGEVLDVVNFLNAPQVEQYDPRTFLLSEDISGELGLYRIFYMADEGAIIVSLLSPDLATARTFAEIELQSVLGLDEWETCRLEVRVTTPRDVSEQYSGQDLGLSFCPFSQTLN